jgi:ribonuclease-3
MDTKVLRQIEKILQYKYTDKELLKKAFRHSSSVDDRSLSNERLEFLGDSVLELVICQELYERFSNYLEGDLTKIKSMLVSRKVCAKIISDLGLIEYLEIGKGMTGSRSLNGSLAAGLFEALTASIYQDGGFEEAKKFLLRCYKPLIDQSDANHSQGNYKSVLQQYVQNHFNTTPCYELLDEKGPDHNKCFESVVSINGRHFRSAWGTNKKDAEQKASYNALVELGVLEEKPSESDS